MLYNTIKLQLQVADKVYHFLCDNDSPIQHVKEALVQMLAYAQRIEEQIKAQQTQAITEQSKQDVPKPQDADSPASNKVESINGNKQ